MDTAAQRGGTVSSDWRLQFSVSSIPNIPFHLFKGFFVVRAFIILLSAVALLTPVPSTELYDPSRPLSSDSESELSPPHDPNAFAPGPDTDLRRQQLAGNGRRWESGVQTSALGAAGLKRDCRRQTVGQDQEPPPAKVSRIRDGTGKANRCPINCDICEVELANAQELEEHLDTSSHWETLEHIQQKKNYNDLVIAFLQEVMLCKSRHCSRAVEDNALTALQENDHMTKVEMFHCAACKVYTASSAEAVQNHVTSSEHLSNAQEFKVQQRRSCLYKAETMLKELQPQFEHFLKGGSLMEGYL